MVTYGPFPGGWPFDFHHDFTRIRRAGFQALRLYTWPTNDLLDCAQAHGLVVFAGLEWPHARDFLGDDGIYQALRAIDAGLIAAADHPAMAGVFVANEIPADLVRWMGPIRVRIALESLIHYGKQGQPNWLWAYANYPSTEFLEPENADVTAMNVYLEDERAFRAYVKRLQHIAGDRPLLISEFGLDSERNGLTGQADTLQWGIHACHDLHTAGITVYAWSDRWWNQSREILDWSFGLTDRENNAKPAYHAVHSAFAEIDQAAAVRDSAMQAMASVSVIVCTRNGRQRIGECLDALASQRGSRLEVIVVDDGSTDGTADFVERFYPQVTCLRIRPSGLSAARNAGAMAASGKWFAFTDDDCRPDPEWLGQLAKYFEAGWAALGGPNLPPPPSSAIEAIIAAAPGAASHVMLDDEEAEHLPGCNIAVTAEAFAQIGGFDTDFHTAGDDVDFCWRLRDAGYRLGFVPSAFVWHHRRSTLAAYLRQQIGYGRAEAILMKKHPARFTASGNACWRGTIYSGAPVRICGAATIYHGPMGLAGYQGVISRMQPQRGLRIRFRTFWTRILVVMLHWLAPWIRTKARIGKFLHASATPMSQASMNGKRRRRYEWKIWTHQSRESFLQEMIDDGWVPATDTDHWDLERNGIHLLVAAEHGDQGLKGLLIAD